jgi:hypothetical protein
MGCRLAPAGGSRRRDTTSFAAVRYDATSRSCCWRARMTLIAARRRSRALWLIRMLMAVTAARYSIRKTAMRAARSCRGMVHSTAATFARNSAARRERASDRSRAASPAISVSARDRSALSVECNAREESPGALSGRRGLRSGSLADPSIVPARGLRGGPWTPLPERRRTPTSKEADFRSYLPWPRSAACAPRFPRRGCGPDRLRRSRT